VKIPVTKVNLRPVEPKSSYVRVGLYMKQLFRGFCLLMCLQAYAFSQTESVTAIGPETGTSISEKAESLYLFGVVVDVLEEQTVYKVIDRTLDLESYILNNTMQMNDIVQTRFVAFIADSGLYSGFGTAWYRNYPSTYTKELEFLNSVDRKTSKTTEINLNSLFKTSLSFNEEIDVPIVESITQSSSHSFSSAFSQPFVQVSLEYRNSF